MTDHEKIDALEQRIAELELRLMARQEVLELAMAASQGTAIDALALIALFDRRPVEGLLRMRRLDHQAGGAGVLTREMVARYEIALDLADKLGAAPPLRPQ